MKIQDFNEFKGPQKDAAAKKKSIKDTITNSLKTLASTLFWSTITLSAEAFVIWYLTNKFNVLNIDYLQTLVVLVVIRIVLRTSARNDSNN